MTATAERTWLQTARRVATQLRVHSIRMTTAAGSGHPTSSMSAADVMAVLVTRHLRIDWSNPSDPANDHFVLSKGHASPLLYAAWKALGIVDDYALMHDYRRFGSVLEGHPLPGLPGVDVATTGSLGQGLPAAVGIALAGATTRPVALPGGGAQRRQRTGRGLGVGGRRQGVTFRPAKPHHDRRSQRAGPRVARPSSGRDLDAHRARFATFGWHVSEIDGHDPVEIDAALAEAAEARRPSGGARADPQGQRVPPARGRERLARQAAATGSRSAGDRRARRRATGRHHHAAVAASRCSGGPPGATCRDSPIPARGTGLDAQGVWPSAGRAGLAPRRRRGRCRGRQLHQRRRVSTRASGPLLRRLHRRAADGRPRHRPPGTRLQPRTSPPSAPCLPARTTSCGWPPSPRPGCVSSGRTPASRSARTARRRWSSRTWR